MRINEVDNPLSHTELDQLEVFADRLFAKVGIDVEFTRHFLDRVNDERNVKQITASELTRLFKQEYKKWGKPIAELGPDAEAVLKDLATDLNVPFALRWDSVNNELDLIAKTVMRKKNFKTSNKEFTIQSHDYSLDNTQHKLVHESIQALSSRKLLNEVAVAAVLPVGIAAWNAFVIYRWSQAAWFTTKFTAVAATAYIVANPEKFSWLEQKMAATAMAAQEVWDKLTSAGATSNTIKPAGDKSHLRNKQGAAATATLTTQLSTLTDDLTKGTNELTGITAGELLAATQAKIQADDKANVKSDAALIALAATQAKIQADAKANRISDANLIALAGTQAKIQADAEANRISDANLIALGTTQAKIQADTEANAKSDANLIALGTTQAKIQADTEANAKSDANLIALGATQAKIQANAEANARSDANLIALGTTQAKIQADAEANRKSDANLIALGATQAKIQANAEANRKSDEKLIALATTQAKIQADAEANAKADAALISKANAYAATQAQAKADAQNTAADDKLIKTAQAVAMQKAADAKADAQNTAADDKLIKTAQAVAMQKAADAKADAQNTAADDKLIKTAQAVAMQKAAAIQARKDHDAYKNKKIDTIATASDAAAKYTRQNKIADAGLIKLATNAAEKAATDAYNNSNEISDNKLKQLAIAAAAATIDKENNKTKSTAVDVTYPIDHHPDDTKKNDVKIATGTYPIGTAFPHTGEHPISVGTAATVGTNTNVHHGELAISKAQDAAKSNTSKTKTGKRHWPYGGDSDLWPTNLYKWTQKYGTFENENLITKYFTLNEGGAMPGVGAIHIDEITPTLQALEKSIGVDLLNNTLGSVGKRQFSGDIDVALQIKPEELPAFIEELKKNPLVLDIAKTSVIMTKVKIAEFDKEKSDGRPRTGFVQVDFMPGDPGWMKTYYHSPSEDESKYKGVYRNIMIATLAAVHNRDESDAKLDDGRAMEARRLMWSPTEGLLRVKRTPVPNKAGTGYTKKNKNETIDGPWKQPDEIAQQLGLDSGKDLNSFESLLKAMQKNWTKEAQQYAVDGFKDNKVIQDIGMPEELQ